MGAKTLRNVNKNGMMSLSATLLALAMLLVSTAGVATAEKSVNAQSLENEELELFANAQIIDASTDLSALDEETRMAIDLATSDGEVIFAKELSDDWQGVDPLPDWHPNLDIRCRVAAGDNSTDAEALEECDELEVVGVVIIVWTDGEVAWVAVIVIYEDGTYDVSRHGPMRLSVLRERLANFDGRIIVNWIDDDADDVDETDGCAMGTMRGQYIANDAGQGGLFRAILLNDDGQQIGVMYGEYQNGHFRGLFSARDGTLTGTLGGVYDNGSFKGQWSASDSDLNGVMKGHYLGTDEGQGVFFGKWKVNCEQPVDPVPVPMPQPIDCQKLTTDAASDSRCDVKPKPKPMPIDVKPLKPALEESDAEGQGGFAGLDEDTEKVVVGGSAGSIALLGLGLLRRRFTLI